MPNACFLLPDRKLSGVPYTSSKNDENPPKYNTSDVDPIVSKHAVHWLACVETYQKSRRSWINDWWLAYQDAETCLYAKEKTVIFAFRGTQATKDLYDDMKISAGDNFPRVAEAISYIKELIALNTDLSIELTGHSLGGAIARESAKRLNIPTNVVTFNAAAPPSSPVTSNQNEVDYHIVFDMISAWQKPNTVRIDKGYSPSPSLLEVFATQTLPFYSWFHIFDGVIPAHELKNFSNLKPGKVISADEETKIMNNWYLLLPIKTRLYVTTALFGIGGMPLYTIPPVE